MLTNTRTTFGRCLALIAALALTACPEDKIVVDSLALEITSDAPTSGASLEHLRLLFAKDGALYPLNANDAAFNPVLGDLDPTRAPIFISVPYDGATFGDGRGVAVYVTGWAAGSPQTRFEGRVDLDSKRIVKVHLVALPDACDGDGDGFLDCTVAGCCGADSVFGDCDGATALANPWGSEPACEPCDDLIDQDCSGGDQPCVDLDNDTIADCAETCGQGDPDSGPGLPELCDGKDNDCNGLTDEGDPGSGAECGTSDVGECAFGLTECGAAGALVCVGAVEPAAQDLCNSKDDDCDGETDEGFSYQGQPVGAACDGVGACGEGIVVCAVGGADAATCSTNPNGGNSGAGAEVCDELDNDCDGELNEGLTNVVDSDCLKLGVCATHMESIAAACSPEGAWTCDYSDVPGYEAGAELSCDGLDNDCDGETDEDFVYAGVAVGGDCDGIGACGAGAVVCAAGSTTLATCSTDPNGTEPQATTEACNGEDDDCDGIADEGFGYQGLAVGAACDGIGECGFGRVECVNLGAADCSTNGAGSASQVAPEVCNSLDDDCDGQTDNGFVYVDPTGNPQPVGQACDGIGACGMGTVECASAITAACSTNPNGSASEATTEMCNGADDDCDNDTDEGFLYQDLAVGATCDGVGECGFGMVECVDTTTAGCSSNPNGSASQARAETCNGDDDDCDGVTDNGFSYTEPNGATRILGEACAGQGICGAGFVECANPTTATCSSNADGSASEAVIETCNREDDDCDGVIDDGFTYEGLLVGDTCDGVGACGFGEVECRDAATAVCSTNPNGSASGATDEACNGIDDNCDGATDDGFAYLDPSGAPRNIGQVCDGIGECGNGVVQCANATTAACSTNPNGTASEATTETCNGRDDDCDSASDEGFTYQGAAIGLGCDGIGECGAGTVECINAATAGCSSDANGSASQATVEICDGADNDCNGTVDNGFSYVEPNGADRAFGEACEGIGACGTGLVECFDAATPTCSTNANGSASQAVVEICNREDDDCDGVIDDGFTYEGILVGETCDGIGSCSFGEVECSGDLMAVCSTNPNGSASGAVVETCNGQDDDCDSATDEGFLYVDPAGVSRVIGDDCDGIGECGEGVVECANAATAACSTNPNGSASEATPEVCNALDDDCDSGTDEGLDDADEDGACDAGVDGCVDADGDGIGRDSDDLAVIYRHDECRVLGTDCDDTPDNGRDLDRDNICNSGLLAICQNGIFAECDDNCPDIENPTQTDVNNNAVGDACDLCAGTAGEPFEVCGNCLDDDCTPATDEAGACVFRRILAIQTDTDGLPAGYSMSLTFDHAFLVAAGRSGATGADLRVYYRDPTTGAFSEIHRVLDPESSWATSATKIWFKSQAAFTATSSPNRDYYLYHRVPTGTPLASEASAFHFADYFDRENSATVGSAWNEQEVNATTAVDLLDKSLNFTTTVDNQRQTPAVFASFGELSSGRVLVRTKWNWTRVVETQFALAMQIGNFTVNAGAGNSSASLETANTIATLAWGRGIYSLPTTDDNAALAVTRSSSISQILANFDGSDVVDTIVDFTAKKVSVDPDGDGASPLVGDIAFFSDSVTLKGIRFFASRAAAGAGAFSSRKYDYVYVRKLLAVGQAEPRVVIDGREPLAPRCELANTNLVARYFLDDPRDDADDIDAIVAKDSVAPRVDLDRIDLGCGVDCLQPRWTNTLGLFGLAWTSASGGGRIDGALAGTKFADALAGLQGATVATVEFVVKLPNPAEPAGYLFDIYGGTHRLALQARHGADKSTTILELVMNDIIVNSWTISRKSDWSRSVFHLTIDSDPTNRTGLRLYRDGSLVTADIAIGVSILAPLDLSGTPELVIGNSAQHDAAQPLQVYYMAFYRRAFTAAEAFAQHFKLIANDDRR